MNHINENREDNRLENLNLLTSKENNNWGTKPKKTKQHIKTLKKKVVCFKDGEPFMSFPSITAAAEEFGTSVNVISGALRLGYKSLGYTWKYI